MTGEIAAAENCSGMEPETDASLWDHLREANRLFMEDKTHGGRAGVIHAIWTILEVLRPIELDSVVTSY
jgi:hypothetical protein